MRRLVRASCLRPRLTVVLALASAVLAVAYAAWGLAVETSKLHLLPAEHRYANLFRAHVADFGELEDIVVVVRGPTLAEAGVFVERLTARLRERADVIERVLHRVDAATLAPSALLYLPLDTLRKLHGHLLEHEEMLGAFLARPTLDQLLEAVNRRVAETFVGRAFDLGLDDDAGDEDLGVLTGLLRDLGAAAEGRAGTTTAWAALLPVATPPGAGYLTQGDGLLFVLVRAAGSAGYANERAAIAHIRARVAELRAEFPAVEAGVTGAPALYSDELAVAFANSQVATVLATVLTLGLLLIVFRRVRQPLLMLLALAVGQAWSLAFAAVTVGHLTMFSVMFMSIVIGIGIDYGIYVLFRCEEERAGGRALPEALELTAERIGPGIVMSATVAAATFYVLAFTDFRGISEFGFIAGSAILLSCLAMLTVFPALLVLTDSRRAWRPRTAPRETQGRVARAMEAFVRRPRAVLLTAAVLTGAALGVVPRLSLDYNVLDLQAHGTESVAWEKTILKSTGRSGFPALATVATLDDLLARQAAFAALPSVSGVESVLRLLPAQQPEKTAVVRELTPLVSSLRVGPPRPLDLDRLVAGVERLSRRFDVAAAAAPASMQARIEPLRAEAHALLRRLREGERARVAASLGALQARLYDDLVRGLTVLQQGLEARAVGVADLPPELRSRYVGTSGRLLLEIHPRVDIWTREGATRFVEELRTVDADVTGQPIIAFESIRLMERAYQQGTVYALALVAVITVLTLRRARESWLAMIPLVLGVLWGLGLMRLFGVSFNLANVWGIPLIIGAAAEFGLNIVLRAMEGSAHGGPLFARSTMMSVLLNGLTTIAGFGSLLVADHQGIWSLGLLLVLGTTASLVASLVVLPILLRATFTPLR